MNDDSRVLRSEKIPSPPGREAFKIPIYDDLIPPLGSMGTHSVWKMYCPTPSEIQTGDDWKHGAAYDTG